MKSKVFKTEAWNQKCESKHSPHCTLNQQHDGQQPSLPTGPQFIVLSINPPQRTKWHKIANRPPADHPNNTGYRQAFRFSICHLQTIASKPEQNEWNLRSEIPHSRDFAIGKLFEQGIFPSFLLMKYDSVLEYPIRRWYSTLTALRTGGWLCWSVGWWLENILKS